MKKILIIEDDPALLKGLIDSFKNENYDVISSNDGSKGFDHARKSNPDIIILDLMLPGKDGLEICRDLRNGGCSAPILMLTSKKEEVDKVLGLEMGADDYVTKPFSLRELHARVKALLRRGVNQVKDLNEFEFGSVKINFKSMEAFKKNKPVELSAMEFKILKYLAKHENELITRDMLLDDVWGYENYPTTRTVDNFILSLRKKLEDVPSEPEHILTLHKSGYKFVK